MRSLYVLVAGCGRLGSQLANLLSRDGHQVVVVDRDLESFKNLREEYFSGYRVEGDATEVSLLRSAKIAKADLVIAATQDDNVNLMVALVARKIFRIRHVMARVHNPSWEDHYLEQGIVTVCPTKLAGAEFFKLVFRALETEERQA